MSAFLAAPMLWLAAILGPAIVIMYMLKLKRRPQAVPSTLLWRRSIQDLVANSPFQKLRNNLLMWLQLLVLLLLVLALARPVFQMAGMGGQTIVLLVDMSASMQTREADGRTRFEMARDLAMEAVDQMRVPNPLLGGFGPRDQMMVLGIADKTIPLQALTGDKSLLRTVLLATEPFDTPANVDDVALILQERTMVRVGDTMEPNPDVRVVLISDGGLGPSTVGLAEITNLDFVSVGSTDDNVGFTAAEVRESFASGVEYQVFASLETAGTEPREVFVELTIAGQVLDLKQANVRPGVATPVVFTLAESVTGLAELRLVDHTDSLPLDDVVRVVVAPPTEIRILLVTAGNPFLQQAFGTDPRVRLNMLDPSGYEGQDGYDIVVLDRLDAARMPAELPPGGYVFVDCMPPASFGFTETDEPVQRPLVVDWSRVHPTTRMADFETLRVQSARRITLPMRGIPLVQALDTDLISALETDSHRVVVIGFDILKSYWPVDVSYLFFVLNLVDHWGRVGRAVNQAAYASGSVISVSPPRDALQARVLTPRAERMDYDLEANSVIYLTDTGKVGLYEAVFDGKVRHPIAVNLFSRQETSIAPMEQLEVGGALIQASAGALRTRQELWSWFVLAGLAVLMVEWAIYCRRTFV